MIQLIAIWLFPFLLTLGAQPQRELKSLPFAAGERLVYEVKFSRFPVHATVGELVLEYLGTQATPVIKGLNRSIPSAGNGPFIHLRAEAVSRGWLIGLFGIDVANRYETLVDPHNFTVCLSFTDAQDGKRHRTETLICDGNEQTVRYTRTDLLQPGAPAVERVFPRQEGRVDLLAALYFVRMHRLKAGQTLLFPVTSGGENYQFEIAVHKPEKIATVLGKVRAIKLEPKLFGPGQIFTRPGQMWMWVTNDERQVPVKLLAKTASGTITATLISDGQRCRRTASCSGQGSE